MPAVSAPQQRLFGMVDSYQKGELAHPSAEVRHLAHSMTHKQVHDFAATKGLALGGALDEEDKINAALRLCKPEAHMAFGGVSPEIPYFERREAAGMDTRPYGFSAGVGSGRFDKNNVEVGGGSYVLPADVVAGLGEGNSLAGARLWTDMLSTMPYGIPAPHTGGRERGPPRPPSDPELASGMFEGTNKPPIPPQIARGGKPEKGEGDDKVPIVAADGEIIVSPEDVTRIGMNYWPPNKKFSEEAALRHGHEILDEFVRQRRGQTIKELKELPGPRNSKEPKKGHVHVG